MTGSLICGVEVAIGELISVILGYILIKFLDKTKIIRRFFIATKNNLKDKNNHYYLCPNCYQVVRVPKGRGKVEIHCPKCNKVFKKKS